MTKVTDRDSKMEIATHRARRKFIRTERKRLKFKFKFEEFFRKLPSVQHQARCVNNGAEAPKAIQIALGDRAKGLKL